MTISPQTLTFPTYAVIQALRQLGVSPETETLVWQYSEHCARFMSGSERLAYGGHIHGTLSWVNKENELLLALSSESFTDADQIIQLVYDGQVRAQRYMQEMRR